MIDVEMWDVCIADVPYEDLPESKVRPILIVERGAFVIECLKLTGQPPRAENVERGRVAQTDDRSHWEETET